MITDTHIRSLAGMRRAIVRTLAQQETPLTDDVRDLFTTSLSWLRMSETLHAHHNLNADDIYAFARDERHNFHPLRIVRGSTEKS